MGADQHIGLPHPSNVIGETTATKVVGLTENACRRCAARQQLAHGEAEHLRLFAFVGRVLGKALFERVTVQPQFAHFFLSFMGGHYNYLHMFADLESLDAELHRNLMFLKARGAFLSLPSARKRNVPSP